MRIALVGGTGREGRGLAVRWARAGHDVVIGSRDAARAAARAEELGHGITGGANADVCRGAEVVVLCVPWSAHRALVESLRPVLVGPLVIDITVPLQPPKVRRVHLPEGGSAAAQTAAILGEGGRVVATLHHVSSADLAGDGALVSDVLVCGKKADRQLAMTLVADLGARAVDAGVLANAVALEALTPVLLHINRAHGVHGAGVRITGLP